MDRRLHLAAACLAISLSNNAYSIPRKIDIAPWVEKPMSEAVRPEWNCRVKDSRTIEFRPGDASYVLHTMVPLYTGSDRPLGVSCTRNRTAVLTPEKITIVSGYDVFDHAKEATADLSLQHDITKAGQAGISAWAFSEDHVYFVTKDGAFWHTGLFDKAPILGFRIPSLANGQDYAIMLFGGKIFVSQKNDNKKCLVDITLKPDEENVTVHSSSFESCEGPRLEIEGRTLVFSAGGKEYTITP